MEATRERSINGLRTVADILLHTNHNIKGKEIYQLYDLSEDEIKFVEGI